MCHIIHLALSKESHPDEGTQSGLSWKEMTSTFLVLFANSMHLKVPYLIWVILWY